MAIGVHGTGVRRKASDDEGSSGMKSYESSAEIEATPERVWEILTDAAQMPS